MLSPNPSYRSPTPSSHLIATYNRLPITFTHGRGVWLYDECNNLYLDMLSGISVTNLGHAHPRLIECLQKQSEKLWHTSNLYHISTQEQFAQKLCEKSGMQHVFFCNSGAEANEAAIKIARLHGNNQGIDNPSIIVFKNSFHGRTMATLSATGNPNVQQGFQPLVSGFYQAVFNDINSVKSLIDHHQNIVAIMLEPIQGEGGIHSATPEFMQQLHQLTHAKKILLILDEIQCGLARTGAWFAHHKTDISCDIMTTAKALGNGFPIGACLVNHQAIDIFSPGKHGSTFGGNPLACTVANEVINLIEQENILQNVQQRTLHFQNKLHQLKQTYSFVQATRQNGLMIGIDIDENIIPVTKIVTQALQQKLLINVTAGNTIRLLPPLVCNDEEIDMAFQRLSTTLEKLA